MELTFNKITADSPEVVELESWKNLNNTQGIKKFTFNGEIDFKDLISSHLSNNLVKPLAVVYKHFNQVQKQNEVVGLMLLDIFNNRHNGDKVCTIHHICVHPECQGLPVHVGAHMLNSVITNQDNIIGKDYDMIIAYISKDNIVSQKLFKKMGFCLDDEGSNISATLINPKKHSDKGLE